MKLATYSDGSRDGQLLVVSRDLESAHYATGIAHRMQQALDDWNFIAPQLQDLYETLNHGKARHAFPFEAARCMAPLPRAYQRLSGADLQPCPSDALLGARSPMRGVNFEAGLAVITGDVPPGATPEQGQDAIRLLALIHAWDGGAALGPVAVTPDELGAAWQGAHVQLTLSVAVNRRKLDLPEAGQMHFSFGDLIAAAARARPLTAGTLIGRGQPQTVSLQRGDVVRIEMKDASGQSVFGAIEQTVEMP